MTLFLGYVLYCFYLRANDAVNKEQDIPGSIVNTISNKWEALKNS